MRFRELRPALSGMRVWGERVNGYTFAITYEDGRKLRTEADRKKWVGYTASYKNGSSGMIRIDGLWQSFAAAEEACRVTLRQLRNKQ